MFRELLSNGYDAYWRQQFEQPAEWVAIRLMNQDQAIGVDAPVATFSVDLDPKAQITNGAGTGRQSGGGGRKRGNGGGGGGGQQHQQQVDHQPDRNKNAKARKVTNVSNGAWTTNRRGKALCQAFQTGSCKRNNCPDAHQCSFCLQPTHGSQHPTPCTNNTTNRPQGGAGGGGGGRGSGKGKGKGGKGKGGRYPY